MEPLLSLLGGEGLVREYAADYLFWYVIGGSGTLFIYLPLNFLKSEGKPQASSLLFLLSGGLSGGQFPVRVSQSDDVRVF